MDAWVVVTLTIVVSIGIVSLVLRWALQKRAWYKKQEQIFESWKAMYGETHEQAQRKEALQNEQRQILERSTHTQNQLTQNAQRERDKIAQQKSHLLRERNEIQANMESMRKGLAQIDEEYELAVTGFYNPEYDLVESKQYAASLKDIKTKQKAFIKAKKAIVSEVQLTIGGDAKAGQKMTDRLIRLGLAAFNTQADNVVLKVTYKNIKASREKVRKIAHNVNRLLEPSHCRITEEFVALKIQELELAYRYDEKRRLEKEREKEERELIREEERAKKEMQKQLKAVEKERVARERALALARAEVEALMRQRSEKMEAQQSELLEAEKRMAKLEAALEEAKQNERAISQAQITRRGHVYIISNIGSFGEGVYKIGMTRRLNPMERVKELSSASVPFEFDVHAMIYSDDAPELEKQLHHQFAKHRVNRVNARKEFFKVPLEQIEQAAQRFTQDRDLEFRYEPEAHDYFMTQEELAELASMASPA